MTTYAENAYSDDEMTKAVEEAGYESFDDCIAKKTAEGKNLTQIAEDLGLKPQRFWAFYRLWAQENIPPLRLREMVDGDGDDD